MKKMFAFTLALALVFALAACGGGNDDPKPSGSTDPGTGQQQNPPDPDISEPDDKGNQSHGEIFDIADTAIRAYASDLTTTLAGDEAAELIAKIPAEIKKGIGELGAGLCTIAPDYSGDGSYTFGAAFIVPKDFAVDYYAKLTDYYKTLEGTVTDEAVIGDNHFFEMEFSWGNLYQCEIGAYNEDHMAINVGFNINEQ